MDNLRFGLDMTLFGMGTVFLLLILLMVVLYALGAIDRPRRVKTSQQPAALVGDADTDPDDEPDADPDPTPAEPGVRILADGLRDDQIAAITIAVLTHAEVRRREAAPVMRRYFPGTRMYASRWVTAGRAGQHTPWTRPTRPGNGS